jgi:hypothetical protein
MRLEGVIVNIRQYIVRDYRIEAEQNFGQPGDMTK